MTNTRIIDPFGDISVLPSACIIIQHDGAIYQLNKVAAQMLGKPAEQLLGTLLADWVVADFGSVWADFWLALTNPIDHHQYPTCELQLNSHHDEQPVWVRITANTIPHDNTYCLILTDIDQYKQQEVEARQQGQLLDNIKDAIITTDNQFVIQRWNKGAEVMYGWTAAEALGQPFPDIVPTSYTTASQQAVGQAFDEQGDWYGEVVQQTKNGRFLHVLASVNRLYDRHGHPIGTIAINRDITARKQAENRYQLLVEQHPAVIYLDVADEKGTSSYISPQIENLLGYPPEAYTQNPSLWHEQLFPDDYDIATNSITAVLKNGQAVTEYRMITRNGRVVWVRDSAALVKDEKGRPQYIQGFLEDMTEYKQTKETLRESQAFLQATLDALSSHIAILDEKGTILSVNDAWRQFAQANSLDISNDAVGQNYLLAHDTTLPIDEDSQAVVYAIKDVLAGQKDEAHLEYPCHGPDQKRWFIAHITSFAEGKQTRAVIAHENITERKLATIKLRETQILLSSLLEHAPVSIFVDSLDLRLKLANKRWEEDNQLKREDVIGRPLSDVLSPDIVERYRRENQEVAEKGPMVTEQWVDAPHGRRRYYTVKFPIPGDDGQVTAVAGVSIDITQQAEAELELRERIKLAQFQASVGAALVETGDMRQMLQRCTEAVVTTFNAAFARIWTLNPQENILELQASAGLHTHIDGQHSRIPLGQTMVGHIAQEKKPHLSNDLIDDPLILNPEWVERNGLMAFAGYPLLIEKRLVGMLAMFTRHKLTDQHLQAMTTIVNYVALAIERKQNEEALQHSQALLQIAGETAKMGGWQVDKEASLMVWSEEVRAIHEAAPGILSMDEALTYYAPEYQARVRHAFEECMLNGTPFDIEVQIITAVSQQRIWVRAIGRAVYNDLGHIERIQGAFQDITERKHDEFQLQEQLSELRRWYRATLGREDRILDLKREVNQLLNQLDQPIRYTSVEEA